MKIAITGGNGFIGKNFVKYSQINADIHILGRQHFEFIEIGSKKCKYHQTDYSTENLKTLLWGYDAVVHLAAQKVKDIGYSSGIEAYFSNLSVSDNLFQACYELGIKNVVNASSRCVYPCRSTMPCNESEQEFPLNDYGISKLAVEKIAELYNRKGSCIKSLRFAIVFGVEDTDNLLFHSFITNAREKKALQIYGTGSDIRHYVYVRDVVRAMDAALLKPNLHGTWNVAMKEPCSILNIAETISRVFSNDGNLNLRKDKLDQGENFYLDISSAQKDLNFVPSWDIEQAIGDIFHQVT